MLHFILQANTVAAAVAADTLSNTVTGIQTAAEPATTEISIIDLLLKGSLPIMLILGISLFFSIYILVERLLVIAKASKASPDLFSSLKEMIHSGNLANARLMCRNTNTPESLMLEQGVSRIGNPAHEIREAMTQTGANEIAKLEKNLNVLNITGRIAPMFGFIGTIIGVIVIFYDIAQAKTVEIDVISKGLYQKMITSASGLVVGVIAFVAYHWLNARIDKLARRMEDAQIRFLDMLNEPAEAKVK